MTFSQNFLFQRRKSVKLWFQFFNKPLTQGRFSVVAAFSNSGRAESREQRAESREQRAELRSLCRTVVMERELRQKAKLSIYRSISVPTLSYGHEGWVVTERTRSRIQAAEMGFLRRVAGVSLRDGARSSAIGEGLGVEPLLL